MYYAILAYHEEGVVESWSEEEDAALMAELLQINDRLVKEKSLGPAARLGQTQRNIGGEVAMLRIARALYCDG